MSKKIIAVAQTLSIPHTVLNVFLQGEVAIDSYLERHESGDWGLTSEDEQAANDLALTDGGKVVSRFEVSGCMLDFISQGNETSIELAEVHSSGEVLK